MLYLSPDQVRQALSPAETLDAVQEALLLQEHGDFIMPDRLAAASGEDSVFILMPAIAAQGISAKVLTLHRGNGALGLPVIQGLVLLCDRETGAFQAILDGPTVTSLRTGAVTGLSIRHLAPADATTVGLVGCGVQGYYQLLFACAVRPIRQITLFTRTATSLGPFVGRLQQSLPKMAICVAHSTREVVERSQIVIAATTARDPVFDDDPALFRERHFVAVGSFQPEVREYPNALFRQISEVWVDTPHAVREAGELIIPLREGLLQPEQIRTLGSLIAGGEVPAVAPSGATFFKTVGMALFDLTAARHAYERALALGIGTPL